MRLKGRKARRRGQGMTEYIIIVALVAIATIFFVGMFGDQVRSLFKSSSRNLAGHAENPEDMTSDADPHRDLQNLAP